MLQSGVRLCSADVAILASIGMHEVAVRKFPKTAIISTGDELVDVESTPLSYQIRKSNVWALSAALSALQIEHQRYHLNDDLNQLESQLKLILDEFKVVILSGGVSKGKADFVPQVLDQLGVKKLFHRVEQKPGKPFWFGSHNFDNVVFALPGNPVSTLLCFYRYFRPWYFKIMDCEQEIKFAELGQDYEFSSKLTYFLQVKTFFDQASLKAIPMNGKGSGDFSSLADADGFLELPAEQTYYRAGQIFPYFEYRNS